MAFPIFAAVGAAASIYQGVSGAVQARKARKALNEFDRQELDNVYENVRISRVGSDLIKDQNALVAGNAIEAARSGGIRGIMSTLPKIQANTNSANREARKYLDDQVIRREYAEANDNIRIQQMQEQRDNADLAGLGQQLQTGQQNMWSGIRGLANVASGAAAQGGFGGGESNFDFNADNIPMSTGFIPGSMPVPQQIGF